MKNIKSLILIPILLTANVNAEDNPMCKTMYDYMSSSETKILLKEENLDRTIEFLVLKDIAIDLECSEFLKVAPSNELMRNFLYYYVSVGAFDKEEIDKRAGDNEFIKSFLDKMIANTVENIIGEQK